MGLADRMAGDRAIGLGVVELSNEATTFARMAEVAAELRDEDGADVLVIFQASEAYISPNWYPSKPEHHRHVPTWNYQVVHAHGRLRVMDDERFVRGLVARLTREHEQRSLQEKPWKMGDSAPEFIDGLLQAIVGIEIEVTRLVGKSKLGQNREERDRLGAAAGVAGLGNVEAAEAMRGAGGA
mgnify:CR=1 FL=1